jgi:hypothetical protein
LAQYPNNGNQKITLGEQTTADGLVFRGVANDTNVITPFSDTSAYIILDTANSKFYHYNRTTTYWALAGGGGGSTLDTATMLLPYYRAGRNGIIQVADVPTLNQNTTGSAATLTTARNIRTNLASAYGANFDGSANITPGVMGVLGAGNGGTGASNFGSPNRIPFVSSSGSLTTDTFFAYNGSTQRLGVGIPSPTEKLHVDGNGLFTGSMSLGTPLTGGNGGTGLTTFGSANRIPYASSTTALTTSDNLTFDGTVLILRKNSSGATFATLPNISVENTNTGTNSYSSIGVKSLNNGVIGDLLADGFGNLISGGGILFRTFTNHPFLIQTNATNRLIITANGNFGIGTTTPQSGYRLHVVDSVYVGGNVSASAYTTRSDYNLKDDIFDIKYGLNDVLKLQPVEYTYKSNGSKQLGFIAQDIGTILPEVVSFEESMSVNYQAIIPILTKAIQEQQALIKALEQRIINLENK